MLTLKAFICLTIFATVLATELNYYTKYLTLEQYETTKRLREGHGWNVTLGVSNYGDVITGPRQNGDVLLVRETMVAPQVSPTQQVIEFTGNFRQITAVRVLNFGLDRAYTQSVSINAASTATIVDIIVKGNTDPRLLVEVYGY